MRLAFLDPIDWDYTVQSAYERPLGGSQSALCYLCEALARRGHDVFALTNTTAPGRYRGVSCLSLTQLTPPVAQSLDVDACIVLNLANLSGKIRQFFGPRPLLVLWTGHATHEPAIQELASPAARDGHDAFVFASEWQRAGYIAEYQIPPQRTVVVCNAIAPVFERLFAADDSICGAKAMPPVLAYTSTPYRGLELLVELFPAIQMAIPQVRLEVYSSMKVYQMPEEEDQQMFGAVYRACRETAGIEYIGGIPQPELASRLRSVTALAYPNIFPETLCLAVMEAMAAGCGIITSDLGALAETTAGFGWLIPVNEGRDTYKQKFCNAVVDFLHRSLDRNEAQDLEHRLQQQVRFVNEQCTWAKQSQQWEAWLAEQCRTRRA